MTLGDRARRARLDTGKSTKEFADEIGVSAKTVNNVEADTHVSRPIVLKMWAMATGCTVEWLETGKSSPDGDGSPGLPTVRYAERFVLRIAA